MQVSVEATSSVERRMTIEVSVEQVEKEVESRIQRTARTVRLDGFRPGKVPMQVVRRRFGESVRQEVLGEVMRNSFVDALEQEKLNPVGYPRFEPKQMEAGKNLEFVAIFDVYPELKLADFSQLEVEKLISEINEDDVNKMLDILVRQQAKLKVADRAAEDKDTLTIDYKGFVDGEAFEGGTAEKAKVTLGSGQMIPGFEEGLLGAKAGDEVVLNVKFPDEYHAEHLKGKEARFEAKVHTVETADLPELNSDFFTKYVPGCDSESDFRAEIHKNMERELKQAIQNKLKQVIVERLIAANDVDVPKALIEQEIDRLKQEAFRQFGGMSSKMKPQDLPSEIFKAQAETRVKTGLIFNEIVTSNNIQVDAAKVDDRIAEIASTYEEPEEVVEFYKGNAEQKSQIEAVVLEDMVIDLIMSQAKVVEKKVSYEEAVAPPARA